MPAFQVLVAEELEGRNASAVWIDTRNESSTYALSSVGSQELLEKVYVGRAFTPFQHNNLVQGLEGFIEEDTGVLVLPNVTFLYEDGQAGDREAKELFESTWNRIREVQEKHELKVLTSLPQEYDSLDYILEVEKDNEVEIESTDSGLRYDSEGYEQLVYHYSSGVQTTIPFWRRKTEDRVKVAVEN
ncbi:MAG: hypothetical protein ABEK04_01885 [Candidatus Nanohalobium sp.]